MNQFRTRNLTPTTPNDDDEKPPSPLQTPHKKNINGSTGRDALRYRLSMGRCCPTDETNLGNTEIMDFQNITTHEFSHGTGLADLYETVATEQIMYGYST